jgi:hypothetical protein
MPSFSRDEISRNMLVQMKKGGFDFAAFHSIEFYAILPDRQAAQAVARQFCGESMNTTIQQGEGDAWTLQLSKVMVATQLGIVAVEEDLQARVEPLGGVTDGWGVEQQVRLPPGEWLASLR